MSFEIELDPPMPERRWQHNIDRVERLLIKAAMKEVGESPPKIAWYLGITVPTVRNRLERFRITK